MGGRGIRAILIVMLLSAALASVGNANGNEDDRIGRASGLLDAPTVDFWTVGNLHVPDRSEPLIRSDTFRTPQVVVGPDSRTQVLDTTIFPYSAIANLELYEEAEVGPPELVAGCSGSFVGPNVLLTAAHCLWDGEEFGGFVDRLVVVPGANGEVEPFGFVEARTLWVPDAYTTNSQPGSPYDYGLIVVPTSAVEAQTGSFELGILTTSELEDPNFFPTTAGYPGDKPFGTQWVSSEQAFTDVTDDEIVHEIDSVMGQSGSPVWRQSDLAVVGVESSETDIENFSIRLDLDIMYEFMQACQDMGCRINHFLTDTPGDGGAYDRVWERTDLPVASGAEQRTWMWGPEPISKVMFEPYTEAPNGFRTVLYQEKSRMEITDPNSDASSIWYVTNGLATVELMTGNLQLGNNEFEQHQPAEINVAGDGDDPNAPTYVTFSGLQTSPPHDSVTITATVDRAGNVGDDPSLAAEGVTTAEFVEETQHYVASVFWDFMTSSGTVWQNGQFVSDQLFDNPYFATGFPVTEAYWTTVRVGGVERTVLVQAFQRRVLTYTPGNPPGFLVEAGNVGSHYYDWRYNRIPQETPDDPAPPPSDPLPGLGDIVAAFDLASGPEIDLPIGSGMPAGDAYQFSIPPQGFLQILTADNFDDGFFAVESRVTQPSPVLAANCIIYRATPVEDNPLFLESGYWFCLYHEGPDITVAAIVYETSQEIILLGAAEFLEPFPQAADWHLMTVVAEGGKFWFIVDDTVLGSLDHDIGPGNGQIGILTLNFDESEDGPNVVSEFRNLLVFGLAPDEPAQ